MTNLLMTSLNDPPLPRTSSNDEAAITKGRPGAGADLSDENDNVLRAVHNTVSPVRDERSRMTPIGEVVREKFRIEAEIDELAFLEEELAWRRTPVQNERELLSLFGIDPALIKEKITGWRAACEEAVSNLKRRIAEVNTKMAKGSFDRWFGLEVIRIFEGRRVAEAARHIRRLERLLESDKPKKGRLGETEIEQARRTDWQHFLPNLRRVGGKLVGLCPFHQEKTPSFIIFADGRFRCFGCQKSGDTIDFIKETEGLNFVEAVKRLLAY